jgi:hypothetical protein
MFDSNLIVLSVKKINQDNELFKIILGSTLEWPAMEDRKFGIEDREVDKILTYINIENLPENYRKILENA